MILTISAMKTILISAVFFGYYRIFLRNKNFHVFNRIYLLSVPILALLLPCVTIPVSWFEESHHVETSRLWQVVNGNFSEKDSLALMRNPRDVGFLPGNMALFCYLFISLILLLLAFKSYLHILSISKKYKAVRIKGNIVFFNTQEKGTPFSFFNRIYWNDGIDPQSESGIRILNHEYCHVYQRHSLDLFYMELLSRIYWINPIFFLIKKELRAIHEFLADQYVISSSDRFAYAELIVNSAYCHPGTIIGHSFFYNHIKRRITMITKSMNPAGIGSRLMVLPVLIILACAFTIKSAKRTQTAGKDITVVIDAGHGGSDAGAHSANGIAEKDLALSIAKKIQQFSKDYHVHVVMTRDKDELAGNLGEIRESLIYRAGVPAKSEADLFVSIHINADEADPSKNGFDMYVPTSNSPLFEKSTHLGSMISEAIKKDYPVCYALRQGNRGVYVLDHSTVPAILVECGFITNSSDLAFISDEQNQEKIAKDLLAGIQNYAHSVRNP
ncbi:MAG: hypothetical protein C5B59_18965 [Bacteroidetes bacterium]|nr:MAG: hypothetical protein C5B59_18965 [Bacteroidota bacterium]